MPRPKYRRASEQMKRTTTVDREPKLKPKLKPRPRFGVGRSNGAVIGLTVASDTHEDRDGTGRSFLYRRLDKDREREPGGGEEVAMEVEVGVKQGLMNDPGLMEAGDGGGGGGVNNCSGGSNGDDP
ncbi:hypothetical protein AX15_003288 [Amanita polypyramis BW_CC]|nr:hypothetical protein AX15_003288 [Amanita polypyramis BW_CC]